MFDLLLILLGVVLLYFGGDRLVRGATDLARAMGISPLVVGLTVVAFGTSSPELAASVAAAVKGASAVALGNVVGSNVANLGLILGISALAAPVVVHARFVRREVPTMLATSALLLPLLWDGAVGRLEGGLLLAGLAVFLGLIAGHREGPEVAAEYRREFGDGRPPVGRALAWVGVGLVLLVGGAHFLVEGAVSLARAFGVAERVIGITVVAVGTSLPELASCLVAALRREGDIVLGNLIGSNVFNVLGILGTAALVHPVEVPFAEIRLDYLVMMAFSVLTLPLLATGRRVSRPEGALLLAGYVGYVVWLFV